jgi:hypothetical protein
MASIPANLGSVQKFVPVRSAPGPLLKNETPVLSHISETNLVTIDFSAQAQAPSQVLPPQSQQIATPQEPAAPPVAKPIAAPTGTAYGAGGTLMMMDSQHAPQENNSSLDGFLARLAGGPGSAEQAPKQSAFGRGVESSGTVLKRAMVDAADFGNKVGKMLGCDETAPGLKGFIGTNISVTAALVGGLAATPLALIAGVADAIS